MQGLKSYLLANIEPNAFSMLVRSMLLNLGYFEINPIDGRNDHGVDIELYTFTFLESLWVVQVSVQKDAQRKVKETIRRLQTRPQRPIGLVYITNRHITNENRLKLSQDAFMQGYLLHIFDEQWLLARLDVDVQKGVLVVQGVPEVETGMENETLQPMPIFLIDIIDKVHNSLSGLNSHRLTKAYQALSACLHSFHLRQLGLMPKALAQSQAGYALALKLDNPLLYFLASHLHGEALKGCGRHEEAARFFLDCLVFSRQKKEKTWEAVAMTNLAESEASLQEAIALSEAAIAIRQKLGLSVELGLSWGQRSKLSLRGGDVAGALKLADESLHTVQSASVIQERGLGRAHLHAAAALLAAGRIEASTERSQEAERLLTAARDRLNTVRAKLLIIENLYRSQSKSDKLMELILTTYSECIELADGEGLGKLLHIIEAQR